LVKNRSTAIEKTEKKMKQTNKIVQLFIKQNSWQHLIIFACFAIQVYLNIGTY